MLETRARGSGAPGYESSIEGAAWAARRPAAADVQEDEDSGIVVDHAGRGGAGDEIADDAPSRLVDPAWLLLAGFLGDHHLPPEFPVPAGSLAWDVSRVECGAAFAAGWTPGCEGDPAGRPYQGNPEAVRRQFIAAGGVAAKVFRRPLGRQLRVGIEVGESTS